MRKSYMSHRPPPKISLRHDHDWTRGNAQLGSTVEQQAVGKIVRQSQREKLFNKRKILQSTQPIPNPICDRSGQPDNTQDVFVIKGERKRPVLKRSDVKSFHEELCSSDRSGQPDNHA